MLRFDCFNVFAIAYTCTVEEIRAVVARNIKQLRLARGMTQEQVAEAVGVDPVSYRHYEYGMRFPKPDILEQIAKCFGVSEAHIFLRDELRVLRSLEADLKVMITQLQAGGTK